MDATISMEVEQEKAACEEIMVRALVVVAQAQRNCGALPAFPVFCVRLLALGCADEMKSCQRTHRPMLMFVVRTAKAA